MSQYLVGVLIAIAVAAPAQAAEPLDVFQRAADGYWASRGVQSSCKTTITLAPLPVAGLAARDQCLIQLNEVFVRWRLQALTNEKIHRPIRRDYAGQLCVLLVHEEGHIRGLSHTPTGVMAVGWWEPPAECLRVIRPIIRSEHWAKHHRASKS